MAAGDRPRTSSWAALLGLAVGITATIVAWGVLVLAAIDFGRDARAGASQGWLLLAGATVGAIACLFLAIIFAARLQARLKGNQDVRRAAVRSASTSTPAAPEPAPAAAQDQADVVKLRPVPEAPTYRSKHSRDSAEPETEESEDSPAAAYRGKRAAR